MIPTQRNCTDTKWVFSPEDPPPLSPRMVTPPPSPRTPTHARHYVFHTPICMVSLSHSSLKLCALEWLQCSCSWCVAVLTRFSLAYTFAWLTLIRPRRPSLLHTQPQTGKDAEACPRPPSNGGSDRLLRVTRGCTWWRVLEDLYRCVEGCRRYPQAVVHGKGCRVVQCHGGDTERTHRH